MTDLLPGGSSPPAKYAFIPERLESIISSLRTRKESRGGSLPAKRWKQLAHAERTLATINMDTRSNAKCYFLRILLSMSCLSEGSSYMLIALPRDSTYDLSMPLPQAPCRPLGSE